MDNTFYRQFEDKYHGSRELIKSRLRVYEEFLHILRGLSPKPLAIDLGCGRGEWLELLRESGFDGRGVDLDDGMLQEGRERGLQVMKADALGALREQADESLALVSGFHLVEHMSFDDLRILTSVALRKLIPGGLLILETPNPENIVVGTATFFLDPTHVKPIPPQLLGFVGDHAGFQRHMVMRLQESAALRDAEKIDLFSVLNGVSPDYAIVAQKPGTPETTSRFDAAFARHYGLSLPELAARYDSARTQDLERVQTMIGEIARQGDVLRAQVAALNRQLQDANRRAEWLEKHAARSESRFTNIDLRQSNSEAIFDRALNNMERVHLAELQVRDAEYRVQAIYASTSWRLTRPLRSVGSLARNWRACASIALSKILAKFSAHSSSRPAHERTAPDADVHPAPTLSTEPILPPAPSTLNELPEDTRSILRQLGAQSKNCAGDAQ